MNLTIWTNMKCGEAMTRALVEGSHPHTVLFGRNKEDPEQEKRTLGEADIALGFPDPAACREHARLKWVAVPAAGYTRYDVPAFQENWRGRGAKFTNMSAVFCLPCAEHILAMMLALGRQLLASCRDQPLRAWEYDQRRSDSVLLTGQTVFLLGFGSIGRRLAELLAPFRTTLYAVRRRPAAEEPAQIVSPSELGEFLPRADHVVNILPENTSTRNYVDRELLALCKPGARFYNAGRGTTVDQEALYEALESGRLASAYLDVCDPEPLPPEHALWSHPRCHITPHTAGGRHDEADAIVRHFLENLRRFESGQALINQII